MSIAELHPRNVRKNNIYYLAVKNFKAVSFT